MLPTIIMPYDETSVPVIYAAEGMKRIMALAYLLVWVWSEHKTYSELAGTDPQRRMVILIDEVESHLHPKWQRRIIPALLEVQKELDQELQVQFLVATHSPMVTASTEPIFNENTDKLFHLDIKNDDMFYRQVILEEMPFVKFGGVDAWLTSNIFELKQATSLEAEQALEDAKALQLKAYSGETVNKSQVQEISDRLSELLPAEDKFWPRWLFFAEKYGVNL